MDKDQATQFIIQALDRGEAPETIVIGLSRKLGAPPAVVGKFVAQIVATYTPPAPPPPMVDSQPPFIFDDDDDLLPDSLADFGESIEFTAPAPSKPQDQIAAKPQPRKPPSEIDKTALTASILEAIKKHQRHNDIVEMVCQQTGWHWNEAQRFVARAQTANFGDLKKSRRQFMIPFGIAFIVGGVLLMGWSVIAMLDYYRAYTDLGYSPTLSFDFLPLVAGAFLTSFGLIAGGIFGIYQTLTNQ